MPLSKLNAVHCQMPCGGLCFTAAPSPPLLWVTASTYDFRALGHSVAELSSARGSVVLSAASFPGGIFELWAGSLFGTPAGLSWAAFLPEGSGSWASLTRVLGCAPRTQHPAQPLGPA